MLQNHISSSLVTNLPHEPTNSQNQIIEMLATFIAYREERSAMLIKGYAGTGKTTLVHSLVKTLNAFKIRSLLMAPTGRAAKVLSSYAGKNAYTIHKTIYRQKSSKDGFGEFTLDRNLYSNTFFIVDEASMIADHSTELSIFGSGRLLDDLIKFVYNEKNCRLILIGDTAQLPPVGLELSPALDKRVLERFDLEVGEGFLSDIVRQAADSGILKNATTIRELITGRKSQLPQFVTKGLNDVERISGEYLIETISQSYDQVGVNETMVVTRSNKRANVFNQGIRNQIMQKEEKLSVGDQLMVVKNNYHWLPEDSELQFIANGDILEVTRIHGYEERYGLQFADVEMHFVDYTNWEVRAWIMLDTLSIETASMPQEYNRALFEMVMEDYIEVKTKKKRVEAVRSDPFFNALQVKYAYAVTCHKAQGGQWKRVFLDMGYLTDEMLSVEQLRWFYTAFTRATERLFLVNFHDRFFADK